MVSMTKQLLLGWNNATDRMTSLATLLNNPMTVNFADVAYFEVVKPFSVVDGSCKKARPFVFITNFIPCPMLTSEVPYRVSL